MCCGAVYDGGVGGSALAAQTPAAPDSRRRRQHATEQANETLSPESMDKLIREVRHELIMLPYYGVFDNLALQH